MSDKVAIPVCIENNLDEFVNIWIAARQVFSGSGERLGTHSAAKHAASIYIPFMNCNIENFCSHVSETFWYMPARTFKSLANWW